MNTTSFDAVRDLDFGDIDNSVFLIPKMDWATGSDGLESCLNRIVVRLVLSSPKFHKPTLLLLKIDGSLLKEENFSHRDSNFNTAHYDLVGITYGQTKAIIDNAFYLVQNGSQDNVRVYDIKKVRSALGSFKKEELRNIFLTIHASTKREKTLESIRRIQNFYYKGQKANCPITEDLC